MNVHHRPLPAFFRYLALIAFCSCALNLGLAHPVDLPAQPSAADALPDAPQAGSQTSTASPAAQQDPSAQSEDVRKRADAQVKQAEHQRILGVMSNFNSVEASQAVRLSPSQKFHLVYKTITDPYIFGLSAINAGIGQAQNSHAAYGQGAQGYFKRYGATYADAADGALWGNAILPVLLKEDPRYFRLGEGTFMHRLLYAWSTTLICRRDDGTRGPNYANVLGNFIAGGISNIYYPAEDRGAGLTIKNAVTVTAEGTLGATLIEFWPDILNHYHRKRQAKQDAADAAVEASRSRKTNPAGVPPQ